MSTEHHATHAPPSPAAESLASDLPRALTLAAASLGFVVVQLDVTIVNVALQRIDASFGSGVAGLQWIVDAYTIVFAALIPTAGALGDRLGAKRVFMAGFAAFALGSLACGAAPSLSFLIAARAFQGIGAAVLVPCSLAIISHAYHDEAARAKAVGIWAGGASVALAAGPVIGGLLVDGIGWRSIFLVNAPIGLVGIWLTARYAAESPRTQKRGIDLAGQIAGIAALAALAAAAIEAGRLGLAHPVVIAAAAIFVVAAAAFIAIEARGAQPMLPLSFFRSATFSAATLVGLLINIAYYGLIFLFSLFFQQIEGDTPLATGAAFLPMTAVVLAANLLAGHIAARVGPRMPMVAGQAIFALGCLALLPIGPATPYRELWWGLLLLGAGIGLTEPPMTAAVLSSVERRQSGIASGVLNATRQAGSVVGVALFGALIAERNRFAAGAHAALYLSAALLLLGCLVAFRRVASKAAKARA